jgi:hypothetical protein
MCGTSTVLVAYASQCIAAQTEFDVALGWRNALVTQFGGIIEFSPFIVEMAALLRAVQKAGQLHGSKDVFEKIGDSITLAVLSPPSVSKSRYSKGTSFRFRLALRNGVEMTQPRGRRQSDPSRFSDKHMLVLVTEW